MESKKCDKGHLGMCCCQCKNQIELFKHPQNVKFKGSIMDTTGLYACIVKMDVEHTQEGIISETKHGACEFYEPIIIKDESGD